MLHFLCFTDIYLSNLQELLPTTIYTFSFKKSPNSDFFLRILEKEKNKDAHLFFMCS